jgi:endonuclease/exonuclease/phosphatase family metal-dependent hydrolase
VQICRRIHIAFRTASLAAAVWLTIPTIPGVVAFQGSTPSPTADARSLTVASLNMARKSNFKEVLRDTRGLFERHKVDILFLQEVEQDVGDPELIAEELARTFDFHWHFAPTDFWEDGGMQGLATLSRFPVTDTEVIPLKHFNLHYRTRNRIGLALTAMTPFGPVRAINVHFDSRINPSERLDQLTPILDKTSEFDGVCIVGGDFNTSPFRWYGRWFPIPSGGQKEAILKSFSLWGFDTPFVETGPTFKFLGLKLDWIFSRGLQPIDWGIEKIDFSDHRAIWTKVS